MYSKALSSSAPSLSANDSLRLGSTFHGLHAIATQIAPVVSAGIERLETDTFVLQCLQTLTGAKFVVTASPSTGELEQLLQGIYELYSDYVLKVNIIITLISTIFMTFEHSEPLLRSGHADSLRSLQSSPRSLCRQKHCCTAAEKDRLGELLRSMYILLPRFFSVKSRVPFVAAALLFRVSDDFQPFRSATLNMWTSKVNYITLSCYLTKTLL